MKHHESSENPIMEYLQEFDIEEIQDMFFDVDPEYKSLIDESTCLMGCGNITQEELGICSSPECREEFGERYPESLMED